MKILSVESKKDINEFENIIKEMPALVKIYSPGCGHCVEMAPAWENLKKNPELKELKFALVAINANTVSDITLPGVKSFQGVPTIREIKKGTGEAGKEYEGNRSTEDMATFIKKTFPMQKGGGCPCNQNGGALGRSMRRHRRTKKHKSHKYKTSHRKYKKSHKHKKSHKKTHRY